MAKIAEIIVRYIMNSRGNPIIEIDVVLADGTLGRAAVPDYPFCSLYETIEIAGGNKKRYLSETLKARLECISSVIATRIVGMDALEQAAIDSILMELAGVYHKDIMGATTSLGVSLAVAKAAAASLNRPLYRYLGGLNTMQMPAPMMTMLNGGNHNFNNLDFREFMLVPVGAVSFADALLMCNDVYDTLKSILESCGRSICLGETGGIAPNLVSNEEGVAVLLQAIKQAGYKPGRQIALALDVAATGFFADGVYNLPGEGFIKTPAEMVEYYTRLVEEYPIVSIKDGLAREDREGWELFNRCLREKIQLLGDDLNKTGDAILIKFNEMTTLTEILDKARIAKNAGYTCIFSQNANTANDPAIADIAVSINADQIKGGAPVGTGQVGVYNQLLRIEEELGKVGNNILRSHGH
ncbi:phosphopyruvate hydratase [Sporomusa sp.]|uniref:phosphopyruvate hydratase n=1 Tax=Sporomusa sp. TaxID=2078658 RepID=UPI002CBF6645|nr:phosphopyruvate hydratase [Sporomusa sp.]HWR10133.1 phosphopyruvate hydratase [Sporomusa sp.]